MVKINDLDHDTIMELALMIGYPEIISLCRTNQRMNADICENDYFWYMLSVKDGLEGEYEPLPGGYRAAYLIDDYMSKIDEKIPIYGYFPEDRVVVYQDYLPETPEKIAEDLGKILGLSVTYSKISGEMEYEAVDYATGSLDWDSLSDEAQAYYNNSLIDLENIPEKFLRVDKYGDPMDDFNLPDIFLFEW